MYLFSGIVLINFFTEALGNASRSIVETGADQEDLSPAGALPGRVRVGLGGALLPADRGSAVACIFTGWHPDLFELLAAIAGFTIVALLATGLGLLFGAANVYFRDSENIVDMLLMIATWASPVLYAWTMVQRQLGDVAFTVYQANPITVAVELFHYAFWFPTTTVPHPCRPTFSACGFRWDWSSRSWSWSWGN